MLKVDSDHFRATGLISMICLCFTIVSGLSALFSYEVRRFLKPILSKFSHNTLALVTFITGMISLIYGWIDTRWARLYDPGNLRYVSSWTIGFIIFFTCIGAFKSWIYQLIGVVKFFLKKSEKENLEDSEKK